MQKGKKSTRKLRKYPLLNKNRRCDVRKIIHRITLVLLCLPFCFWGFLRLTQGHLPGGAFSRSTIVPIFLAHYLRSILVKRLLYINDQANDGITVL